MGRTNFVRPLQSHMHCLLMVTYAQPAVICTSTCTHRYCVTTDASVVYFHSFMFAPNGFTVVATYPDGTSKGIAVLDSKAHAIDYAKGCDSIYAPILERTVYTVKQNYPTSAYTV